MTCKDSSGAVFPSQIMTIVVANDGNSLTVSVGGNISSCYNQYKCNSYGCRNPNGVHTLTARDINGVTYSKAQPFGLTISDVNLTLMGWSTNSSLTSGLFSN